MFARDGYATMAGAALITAAIYGLTYLFIPAWYSVPVYIAAGAACGLVFYFFRDPDRVSPEGEHLILSPADGVIVLIKEYEETAYLKEKATQISIFLSPLNVHVNRVPVSGKLEYLKYHPGKYLMAWNEHSSELNERADFGVRHSSGIKIFFKQITGFMARRIVYHIKEGDELAAGSRFGIMKFGSRMDVIVPAGVKIFAKEGDKTKAGVTVLGEIEDR